MKKIFCIVTIALLLILPTGCAQKAESVEAEATPLNKIYLKLENLDREVLGSFADKAKTVGIETKTELEQVVFEADNQQIEELDLYLDSEIKTLASKYDYIKTLKNDETGEYSISVVDRRSYFINQSTDFQYKIATLTLIKNSLKDVNKDTILNFYDNDILIEKYSYPKDFDIDFKEIEIRIPNVTAINGNVNSITGSIYMVCENVIDNHVEYVDENIKYSDESVFFTIDRQHYSMLLENKEAGFISGSFTFPAFAQAYDNPEEKIHVDKTILERKDDIFLKESTFTVTNLEDFLNNEDVGAIDFIATFSLFENYFFLTQTNEEPYFKATVIDSETGEEYIIEYPQVYIDRQQAYMEELIDIRVYDVLIKGDRKVYLDILEEIGAADFKDMGEYVDFTMKRSYAYEIADGTLEMMYDVLNEDVSNTDGIASYEFVEERDELVFFFYEDKFTDNDITKMLIDSAIPLATYYCFYRHFEEIPYKILFVDKESNMILYEFPYEDIMKYNILQN